MVSKSFVGGLVARAFTASSQHSARAVDKLALQGWSVTGIKVLQEWYNTKDGLWNTAGWWNSANCLTMLADFAALEKTEAIGMNLPTVIQNTYVQAQKVAALQVVKTLSADALPESSFSGMSQRDTKLQERGFDNFLNDYYDDEGWWALALIHSYDLRALGIGNQDYQAYINEAVNIFEDMKKGTSKCGGGIVWSKKDAYTNAIANELYLAVAASLANRMSNKQYYLDIAVKQWNWFKGSGMINSNNLINDGLNNDCKNNGKTVWSYNQGVILGGLVELSKATGDKTLLKSATDIALAAIKALSKDGILHESCEPSCGADGNQFKGIFLRNLGYLQKAAPNDALRTFILANAESIWVKDRNAKNQLDLVWSGPSTNPTAATHSSGMDAVVAALSIA